MLFCQPPQQQQKDRCNQDRAQQTLVHRHGQKGVVDGVVLVTIGGQAAE